MTAACGGAWMTQPGVAGADTVAVLGGVRRYESSFYGRISFSFNGQDIVKHMVVYQYVLPVRGASCASHFPSLTSKLAPAAHARLCAPGTERKARQCTSGCTRRRRYGWNG